MLNFCVGFIFGAFSIMIIGVAFADSKNKRRYSKVNLTKSPNKVADDDYNQIGVGAATETLNVLNKRTHPKDTANEHDNKSSKVR